MSGEDAMGELAIPVQWMPYSAAAGPAAGAGGSGLPFASPAGPCRLVAELGEEAGVAVIGIGGQAEREPARLAIRAAIVAALSQLSGLPPQRIALHAEPGEAPWALLDAPAGQRRAWLAVSHDGELSVAAIRLHGAVGIDVTQVLDIPDWQPVARDYLGPAVAARLAALPDHARVQAFARAWTEREARLKCLGRELTEWSAAGDREVDACRCLPLSLPEGYVGALTLPPH
jgi:4'-phosphopantetheinyl transferase